MKFDLVRNINIQDSNTWKDKIFITLDIDWVSDKVLNHIIEVLIDREVKTTFFVTHQTVLLNKLRESDLFDIGIHPNYNFLLKGDFRYGSTMMEVLKYYRKLVPEATVIRSHSLTTNSLLLHNIAKSGFTHECNLYIPFSSNIILKPFSHWEGNLIRVPHYWEDDINMVYKHNYSISILIAFEGIKVFDFHPIHLFLNTAKMSHYDQVKGRLKDFEFLQQNINLNQYGVFNFFEELINLINNTE